MVQLKNSILRKIILPSFEFKIKGAEMKFLNLSHNRIENINRDAVSYLPLLARLDLSNNDLSKSKTFEPTFSHLFKSNAQLREIDLLANFLEFLPYETLAHNTHLEVLNLSLNAFDQIHFHFWNLPNFTTIDLSLNKIISLDSRSRQSLDHWYRFHRSVNLVLYGNPLSCSCSSLDFVQWFDASPIFSTPSARQYYCHIDDQRRPMTAKAAQEDCDRIRTEHLQIILTSIARWGAEGASSSVVEYPIHIAYTSMYGMLKVCSVKKLLFRILSARVKFRLRPEGLFYFRSITEGIVSGRWLVSEATSDTGMWFFLIPSKAYANETRD